MAVDPIAILSFGDAGRGDELLRGVWVTVRLALTALPVGLAIGLGVALMKEARSFVLRGLAEAYATVFRGLPELLTVFLVYYGAPKLMNGAAALVAKAFGAQAPEFGFGIDAFWAGVTALALVLGAFSSEVFSGAIRGVPRGQREAAAALGMTRADTMRHVVLPQVWRLALPGLGNNWMTLLKDTSLVSVIALPDLMRETYLAALATKQPFLFYGIACGVYLVLSLASSRVIAMLETRASRGVAGAGR